MTRKSRTSFAKRSRKRRPELGLALLLLFAGLGTAYWAWSTRALQAPPLSGRAEAFLDRQGLLPVAAVREGKLVILHVTAAPDRMPSIRAALKREFDGTTALTFSLPSETASMGLDIATLKDGGEKVLLYFLRAPAESPLTRTGRKGRAAGRSGRPALLAVCIDDLGYSAEAVAWFEQHPFPMQAAVLPHLPLTEETARRLHAAGVEVLCHLPMQPEDYPGHDPGPGAVLLGTSEEEVRRRTREAFASVPHLAGFNNHMGSAVTAQPLYMRWIFAEARDRHLYFLDSRTSPRTAAEEVGREMGLPVFRRHVFLDDVAEPAYIRRKLQEACALAREQGLAVAIGHPHPATLRTLAAELPSLPEYVRLARLSSPAGKP